VIKSLSNKEDFSYKFHLVLSPLQAYVVQVNKPKVPKVEIISALKWQIKDLVPISPENMVLDYFDGPLLAGGIEKINVVCSPINELKEIVAALNAGSASLSSIIIEEFAFALIVKQGKLYFHRRLRGFSQIAGKTDDELSTTVIDSLALEIQRSSDYFERQLKQAPIKSIKVLIPISSEGFFARKLSENTHIPVTLLALPEPYQAHRDYAAAIGATMHDTSVSEQTQEIINAS